MCDIDKGPIAGVAIQLHGISLPWQCEVRSHPLASGKVVAGDKQVETAVVIVIPEPGWEAPLRFLDAEPGRDFLKRAIAAVVIEEVVLSIVRDVEVRVAVAIVVSPGDSFGERDAVYARLCRNVLKRTVTFVAEKLAWCVLVSDVEIDPAIIVVISPAGGMSSVVHTQKATLEGHISEGAVAVVAQKRVTHRPFPSAAHHIDVEPTIVVKVSLDNVEKAVVVEVVDD